MMVIAAAFGPNHLCIGTPRDGQIKPTVPYPANRSSWNRKAAALAGAGALRAQEMPARRSYAAPRLAAADIHTLPVSHTRNRL